MDLKLVIYSITKHVRTCICYCKKNNRLTPVPIAAHMDISAGVDSNIEHEYC